MSHRIKISVSITLLHWTVWQVKCLVKREKTHCAHHVCCVRKKRKQNGETEHWADRVWQRTWNQSSLQFIISFAVTLLFCHFSLSFFCRKPTSRTIFGIFSFGPRCEVPRWPDQRLQKKQRNIRSAQTENVVERPPARWKFVVHKKDAEMTAAAAAAAITLADEHIDLLYRNDTRQFKYRCGDARAERGENRNLKIIQTINNRQFIYDADEHK